MRESKIQLDVCAWAREHGILPIKLTSFASGGWPDYLFLGSQGQVAFIEFKAPNKKPGLRQELRIEELRKRGFPVAVVDSYESGIEFLMHAHMLK